MSSSRPGMFSLEGKMAKLLKNIESYDRLLKRLPEDANAHYAKAGALAKLAKLNPAVNYSERAIDSFTKAIEFDSTNPTYLIERAQSFLALEKKDLALKDVEKAKEILNDPEINKYIGKVTMMYANNILRDIEKELNIDSTIDLK